MNDTGINTILNSQIELAEPIATCERCENHLWLVVMGGQNAKGEREVAKYRCGNPECGNVIEIGGN